MKMVKTNAMRTLELAEINYRLHNFLPLQKGEELNYDEIAERTGMPKERIFKTILTKGDSGKYYVLVLQGEDSLDFKKAARLLGEKAIELSALKDLEKITGYVRGGCSPIGMKKQFPTVLDSTAMKYERILVSAGKRGYQIELRPEDLINLIDARQADIRADRVTIS